MREFTNKFTPINFTPFIKILLDKRYAAVLRLGLSSFKNNLGGSGYHA
jgi:hypothetical protein